MASKIPFMKGEQATVRFVIGATPREIAVKSWKITRDVEKISDGVNGEDRNRLDVSTNSFDIALELYTPDAKLQKALLEDQANDDAGVQPLEKALTITQKPRDGTKTSLLCTEVTVDDWAFGAAGRTDRLMTTLPLRARYVKPV